MKKIYLTLLLMSFGVPALWAQVFVTETGAGNKDGSDWDNAYDNTQLQQAIDKAAGEAIKQVWVAKGVYKPTESLSSTGYLTDGTTPVTSRDNTFVLKADVEIYGGFAGSEASTADRVNIHTDNQTILSGDLNNNNIADIGDSYHVVSSRNDSNGAILDSFTIQYGYADGTGSITENGVEIFQHNGGAVALRGGNTQATFINLIVKNNASTGTGDGNGGGAFHINNSTNANVYVISNVTFQDNSNSGGGGALFVRGLTLNLNNSTFKNNSSSVSGGAAYFYSGIHTVSEVLFELNTTGSTGGGAIYGLNNADLTIEKSTFKNNTSTTSGGAIYFTRHGANNRISETVFESNESNNGGAIYSLAFGLAINRTTFKSNIANASGGALYLHSSISGTTTYASDTKIYNTIFYNNLSKTASTGAIGGGAIFHNRATATVSSVVYNANSTVTLVNSTLYANKSVNASGVYSFADQSVVTINLYNNIFYRNLESYNESNNTGTSADIRAGNLTSSTAYLTLNNNLFQRSVVASTNGRKTVANPYYLNDVTEEPLFASTTEGSNNFLWPVQNSFAINKGDKSNFPNADTEFDLLGHPRVDNGIIDLGAIEWSTVLPVTISSFTANLANNRTQLKWNVGTEDNVNRYEVQRSQNGIDFITVATVSANGSASYQAADNHPQGGINYYRLVAVDNDGSHSIYKDLQTIKLASLSSQNIQVYPNPVTGNEVKVSLGSATVGTYNYKVVSASGSVVQQGSVNYNGSFVTINLFPTVTRGLYVLHFSNGTQAKLIKQ